MKGKIFITAFLVVVVVAAMMTPMSELFASPKEEAIAKAVTTYLIAGRAVIAKQQPLINDASKGDKGFTPEVYEKMVSEEFKVLTGKELKALISSSEPEAKAIADVHASAMEAVAEAQPQINEPGKAFKGFIPAVYGARTGDKFYKRSGIRLKQTSLRFRGDYNRPDEFEEGVLKKFESGWEKDKAYSEETTVGGRKVLRYVKPLYIAKGCLLCHGEPAGSFDIAGRIKEGYKEGDVRGGISVIVPIR